MPLKTPQLTKFTTASPAVASFSFQEIISGQSFVKFFLLNTKSSTGEELVLTEQSSIRSAQSEMDDVTELDFDSSPFNSTLAIQGTAVANFTSIWTTAGGTSTLKFEIKLRKWDGTTETEIASVETETRTLTASSSGTAYFAANIVIPRTIIKEGEQLRISSTMIFTGTADAALGTDPSDLGGGNVDSFVNIPFQIDL